MVPAVRLAYAVAAAVDTALAAGGRDRLRRATKPLLMPLLAVGRDRPTARALVLSGAGDVALLGEGQRAFTAGLGAFLAAHIAWVAALRGRPGGGLLQRRPAAAVPYVAAWTALNALLWRRTGADRWPVVVYSGVLTAMAVTALDTDDAPTAVGGALFMASDALLALERFADVELPAHEALVMASYTAAQALLAAGGSR
jgi:uncharacterized membrane protein YhhN